MANDWWGYLRADIREDDDDLSHHGILGQKWGIRNYQNPDGTLTEEGKKRYLKSNGTLNDRGLKEAKKIENKISKAYKKSDRKNATAVQNEFLKKKSDLHRKAIKDVREHDPNIGIVPIMSDGRAYTSRDYEEALKKGLYITNVQFLMTGDTLAETLDQLETSIKYGHDKEIKDLLSEYGPLMLSAVEKDSGLGEEFVNNELYRKYNKERGI